MKKSQNIGIKKYIYGFFFFFFLTLGVLLSALNN